MQEPRQGISLAETPILCKTEDSEPISNILEEDHELAHSPYIGLKEVDSQNESIVLENHHTTQMERGIQLRKKQLQQFSFEAQVQKASESKKLLQVLSEQVLDEKLQLSKKWFACFSQQSDLSTLQRLLCQRWREMNVEEIQSEFQITLEEEDLFYSYRQEHFSLEDLVANYIISSRHWSESIEGKWDVERLREEGFFERLDIDRKGSWANRSSTQS